MKDFKETEDVNITELEKLIQVKDVNITELEKLIQVKDVNITELEKLIQVKDERIHALECQIINLQLHAENLIEAMGLKSRLKKLIPSRIRNVLKKIKGKLTKSKALLKQECSSIMMNGLVFSLKQACNDWFYKNKAVVFKESNIDNKKISIVHNKISIVIPTYNGLSHLMKLIPQLINQQGFSDIELIIVDSCSQDGTKQFIENFPEIKFISIEKQDFSHSHARNLGFEHVTGEYVLFMVQDALPTSETWLYLFFKILVKNNLSALSCIQLPNAEADLYACYGIDKFIDFLGIRESRTKISEKYIKDPIYARKVSQLDNVACLLKSDVFEKYKFTGKYSEDLELGVRLIKDHHRIGLSSEVSVIHSHLRSAYYYMKRYLVETEIVNKMFGVKIKNSDSEKHLSDILVTYCLVAALISEIKKNKNIIKIETFISFTLTRLEKLIEKEYNDVDIAIANKVIINYDEQLSGVINTFHKNGITYQKGSLFYSVHHICNQGLLYLEKKMDYIDEKMISEFILFILKMYASQAGIIIANNKKSYKMTNQFMNELILELEDGV